MLDDADRARSIALGADLPAPWQNAAMADLVGALIDKYAADTERGIGGDVISGFSPDLGKAHVKSGVLRVAH